MKKMLYLFVVLSLLGGMLLAACGGGGSAPTEKPAGDAVAGKTAYDKTCVACHGSDGKGMPGLGKDLTTSQFFRETSDADLLAFVKTGRPASDPANTTGVDMPPKGGNPALTDEDIQNIIAYVRTLQQ